MDAVGWAVSGAGDSSLRVGTPLLEHRVRRRRMGPATEAAEVAATPDPAAAEGAAATAPAAAEEAARAPAAVAEEEEEAEARTPAA